MASNPSISATSRRLRLLRDAIRGVPSDPTQGPVRRAIVLLAVPMVLEMGMESVFAVVDIFFVSRLGAAAVAAVGITEALISIIYTIAIGLGIGVTAIVARRTGEHDPDGAAEATLQAMVLGAALALLVGVIGVLKTDDLLRLLGAGPDVVATGRGYTAVLLGGNVSVLLLFLLNAAFRGAGDAAVAMRVLWIGNALNIVLDPLLIFGLGPVPALGVTGAAVATVTGRSVAVAMQLWILLAGSSRIRIRARHVRLELRVVMRLVRLSAAGTLQTFIGTASFILLVRILAGFGSEAVAGYTLALRIVLFALLPAWGLANAAATMVGQGLGAGDPDRAESSVWIAARMNLVFLGTVGLLFLFAAPAIIGAFGGDAGTAAHAVRALRIVSCGFFFYALGMVFTQSFNGAGAPWTPTILNVFCFWLWEIPLAWLLSRTALGVDGAYLAVPIAFSTLAIASVILFRRGSWKLARV
jgi:putative MATE family efflux protein